MPATGMRGSVPSHPGNPTGRKYTQQMAEAAEKKKVLANPEQFITAARSQGFSDGFDAGYSAGVEAGLLAGWDGAIEFVINAGLVTQDQVDAAVDADETGQPDA